MTPFICGFIKVSCALLTHNVFALTALLNEYKQGGCYSSAVFTVFILSN